MSHLPNEQEYDPKAGQASGQDVTKVHDGIYGTYKTNDSAHPKASTALPAPPSPFTLKG